MSRRCDAVLEVRGRNLGSCISTGKGIWLANTRNLLSLTGIGENNDLLNKGLDPRILRSSILQTSLSDKECNCSSCRLHKEIMKPFPDSHALMYEGHFPRPPYSRSHLRKEEQFTMDALTSWRLATFVKDYLPEEANSGSRSNNCALFALEPALTLHIQGLSES